MLRIGKTRATLQLDRLFFFSLLFFNLNQQGNTKPVLYAEDSYAIPLRLVNNLIVIDAEIDGKQGQFILDSGAPELVLNLVYFRDAKGVNEKPSEYGGGITNHQINVLQVWVSSLKIRQFEHRNIKADLIQLGHIENSRNVKILGLLGMKVFDGYEMEFDLRKGVLFIRKMDKKGNVTDVVSMDDKAGAFARFQLLNAPHPLVIEGRINGRPMRLCLDSAAEFTVLSTANRKTILKSITVNGRRRLVGSGGVGGDVVYGVLSNLQVGSIVLENIPVVLLDLQPMCTAFNYHIDGMLGFDFFLKGIFVLNTVKKELKIYPYSP